MEVANLTGVNVDEERLASGVRLVLTNAGVDSAVVSVAVVDDRTMRRLNRRHLRHDYPTDVLSFVLEEIPRLQGEIIVSLDAASRHAAIVDWSVDNELLLYAVHGALHLVGHRDKLPRDARAMRSAERAILEQLGAAPSSQDSRWNELKRSRRGREAQPQ